MQMLIKSIKVFAIIQTVLFMFVGLGFIANEVVFSIDPEILPSKSAFNLYFFLGIISYGVLTAIATTIRTVYRFALK